MEHLDAVRRALACLDLTLLPDDPDPVDAAGEVEALCGRAFTPHGPVAGVCLPAAWVATARELPVMREASAPRLVSVANFPTGDGRIDSVRREIDGILEAGAVEVDVVLPHRRLAAGERNAVAAFLRAAREACGDACLKVILETGMLPEPGMIRHAADLAIDAGADFLKTSTGKVPVNATPAAADILLRAIDEAGGHVGLKVSGGIGTVEQAVGYLRQAEAVMGTDWVCPRHFRIGASGVLGPLIDALGGGS